jgi:restriction endonuclease-like protein
VYVPGGERFSADLYRRSSARIDAACSGAYRRYHAAVRERHVAWFEERSGHRDLVRNWVARERWQAFPEGWEHLADALPEDAWHRWHLAGGSSQVLALSLLSAAMDADPAYGWMPLVRPGPEVWEAAFEVVLDPKFLNESPRQTSVDFLLRALFCRDESGFFEGGAIAAEAEFTEKGMGQCSCEGRKRGECSPRLSRRPYAEVAARSIGLRHQDAPAGVCGLSLTYQAVRNFAAADALSGIRGIGLAGFVLLYDARNPYFSGSGD